MRVQVPQMPRHATQVEPPRHAAEQVPVAQVTQVCGVVEGVVRQPAGPMQAPIHRVGVPQHAAHDVRMAQHTVMLAPQDPCRVVWRNQTSAATCLAMLATARRRATEGITRTRWRVAGLRCRVRVRWPTLASVAVWRA